MGGEGEAALRARTGLMLRELEELIYQVHARFRVGTGNATATESRPPSLSARALARYKSRRARATLFGGNDDLFGEPAWDLLLDLFVAREAGRRVSVSSACIAAEVPATTALRWLAVLEKRGLVERRGDPCDRRRVDVVLSDAAYAAMEQWLAIWG